MIEKDKGRTKRMRGNLLLASCILGVSIVANSFLVARECRHHTGVESSVLTEGEVSEYLHITVPDLQKIIADDDVKRKELKKSAVGVWDTYRFLPYATVGSTKLFVKQEVDQWIKYRSLHGES